MFKKKSWNDLVNGDHLYVLVEDYQTSIIIEQFIWEIISHDKVAGFIQVNVHLSDSVKFVKDWSLNHLMSKWFYQVIENPNAEKISLQS